ncbi:MAG: hypothetical protein M5U19_04885 [Microthrixaceae bacterium]|nr:hypothetical protein [Microthrixaceae bacterium]
MAAHPHRGFPSMLAVGVAVVVLAASCANTHERPPLKFPRTRHRRGSSMPKAG